MSDAILSFISGQGYVAIVILMIAENIFPPIPSEVILPFIGHLVATGELSFIPAIVAATLGALIGTSFWFAIGWLVPTPTLERFFARYGGYVAIDIKDFQAAVRFFTRFQVLAVLFGRMIPAVRSVISIPAGCVRMRPATFFLFSLIGTLIWNTLLITIGFLILDDFTIVDAYMSPIADIIIYVFIAVYLLQVLRFMIRRARGTDAVS